MKKTKKVPVKKGKTKKPVKRISAAKEAAMLEPELEEYSPQDDWDGEALTEEQQKLHAAWLRTLEIDGLTMKDVRAKCVGDPIDGEEVYKWDFTIVKEAPKVFIEIGHSNIYERFVPHGFFWDGHYCTELDPISVKCLLVESGCCAENIKM